ncbi:GNAT family N-acetyltransferase [Pelagicoccus mobilis]|uniref:GNAT family N-acetyltransferase n=1 Tax=Pelagicoccus mobilis TaxID=415221 RepID=A0A934RSW6_9BACT|nr:GNAT family N-acetyltransferase [Pelagicoccus mobilis]MBK1876257.1 GNAT family N-acetyltransferase [Pelagicoccus mobilis]
MTDMLVKLYGETRHSRADDLAKQGFKINRALGADRVKITRFIKASFPESAEGWAAEAEVSLTQQPSSCMIATLDHKVVGFCCYDATAKGMLGPIGVSEECRGKGVAKELILQSLEAMKHAGYAYAVIGWVSSEAFYEKVCGAITIPDSFPGVYSLLVDQ